MREGSFTGARLVQCINDSQVDYTGTRAIVNGSDHAQEVADDAQRFVNAIDAAQRQLPKADRLAGTREIIDRVTKQASA